MRPTSALDYYIPVLRQLATAHPEYYGSLFHKTFQRYPIPTFALCGHIGLSLAEVIDADVGFGFARYGNPYPNLFFFHGKATIAKVIDAEINARVHDRGLRPLRRRRQGRVPDERTRGSTGTSGWTSSTSRSSSTPRRTPCIEIPPLDFTTGANVLVSNKGLAACLYFKTFLGHVAAGRRRDLGPRPDAVPLRLRRQGLQGRHQARALR